LVQLGVVAHETEHTVDGGAGPGAVPFGSVHQADEDGVVARDEGGYAEHVELVDTALVLFPDDLGRPPVVDLVENGVGVDAGPGQGGVDEGPVAQVGRLGVAGGGKRPVHGPGVIGGAGPHGG